ncbi:hypothetical protein [Rugosimonospora africana]|uniref:Uncharacterized protein n=1 Tax=Rugosimonospora africana TaxID=556532 RepID=A0A8J3QZJ3_9ACTN|nr:hypothetical protein [Rugosimonospora africana]GIH19788.1 hypothetical protein Raf01_79600 [Rugosimonospora africana]
MEQLGSDPGTGTATHDVARGTVQIAYVHAHQVSHSWHRSMVALRAHDRSTGGRRFGAAGPDMLRGCTGDLSTPRNEGAARFLAGSAEWLWWIDTDMGFTPDTVDRLVAAADPDLRPVVGGLCFSVRELEPDGFGGHRVMPMPTIFDNREPPGVWPFYEPRPDIPPDTLVRCDATGAACLLIHRGALERMAARFGPTWFDTVHSGTGATLGEDLSFCRRLGELGIPVYVHTGVRTTHHKDVWVGVEDYPRQESHHVDHRGTRADQGVPPPPAR